VEDSIDLGTTVSKKSYHHSGLSPMRPNEFWTCPDDGAARHKPLVFNMVVVGPFKEEEEGTGIASDVVKVDGEDPATPDDYLRCVDARTTQDRNNSPMLD